MSTTAKDIIQPAFGGRTANDPDKLSKKPELIRHLSLYIRRLYIEVMEVDPEFFVVESEVTGSGGVWTKPATHMETFYVENASGDEVAVVPFRDKYVEIPPRIYELGGTFRTVGETGDPAAAAVLTFYSAFLHPELDSTLGWDHATNTLDDTWPERHNTILIEELKRYLAYKDGRFEDAKGCKDERDEAKALLFLEAKVKNAQRSRHTGA